MQIRLTIIATPPGAEASSPSMQFDESGGVIGRSAECDWVIDDPTVSRRHAEVFFQDGSFYLRDLSHNGTFLNDSDTPLGRGNTVALSTGNRIGIGGWVLGVAYVGDDLDRSFLGADAEDLFDETMPWADTQLLDEFEEPGPPRVLSESADEGAPAPLSEDGGGSSPAGPFRRGTTKAMPDEDKPFGIDRDAHEAVGGFARPPAAPEVPPPPRPRRIDTVDFAVFGPPGVMRGQHQIIDVWAYSTADFDKVQALASQVQRAQILGRKVGLPVWREAVIQLTLSMPGVDIPEASDRIVWNGEPTNASFVIAVPLDLAASELVGKVTLSVDGVPFGQLVFTLPIGGSQRNDRVHYEREFRRIRKAFASYASAERADVLARLQGMRALSPDLDVFVDVLSLRAGDDWKARLRSEVPTRDVFYLFWSQKASASTWVSREWHMALEQRGIDYIVPVPLQDPRDAPPPEQLRSLHFNDAYLDHIAYLRLREGLSDKVTAGPG